MNYKTDFDLLDTLSSLAKPNLTMLRQLLACLDLTKLDKNASTEAMLAFKNQLGTDDTIAAFCVYPEYLKLMKDRNTPLATVANFPDGDESLKDISTTIAFALNEGADEIDLVLPYKTFLSGKESAVKTFLLNARQLIGSHCFKLILETGAFPNCESIYKASLMAIDANVDFIKTSTGKIEQGASLEAALAILSAIKDSHSSVGLKISGGIRKIDQARQYQSLFETVLKTPATPTRFRIGASQLFNTIKSTMENNHGQ